MRQVSVLLLLAALCAGEVQVIASAQVEFSQLYYVVSEEEGWVEVDLTASGPTASTYTIIVTTIGGSAHKGDDFADSDYSVMFKPGMTTAKVYIAILNDATTLEGDEQFTLALKDTPSSRDLGVSIGATAVTTVTIIDNDIIGVEFSPYELSININKEEELILQLTTTGVPNEHFFIRVHLQKGSPTGNGKDVPSSKNEDSYIAFFGANKTTSKLHIPVEELMVGVVGETILASLSIPDIAYSLGVRASAWDSATITISREQSYESAWYLLDDDSNSDMFFVKRLTREAGALMSSGSGTPPPLNLSVCDAAPAYQVTETTTSRHSVVVVFAIPVDNFTPELQCLLQIEVADAATVQCASGLICSLPQLTNVTFLPGHVIITDVSASGATETIVTLYIALPLNATPLDSENPTIPGDVTAIIVQAAESSIEAALGIQVVDNSIVRAPIPEEPNTFFTTAILLAIIIPVVVGALCLAGLAALLVAIVIFCVVKKKKKTAVAPTPIPVLGTGMTTSDKGMTTPGSLAGSKEILVTEWEQEKA